MSQTYQQANMNQQDVSPYMELKKQDDLISDVNSQATRSQTKKNYQQEDTKSVKSISRYSKVASQKSNRKSVKVLNNKDDTITSIS